LEEMQSDYSFGNFFPVSMIEDSSTFMNNATENKSLKGQTAIYVIRGRISFSKC
jgi:hypothetical protein